MSSEKCMDTPPSRDPKEVKLGGMADKNKQGDNTSSTLDDNADKELEDKLFELDRASSEDVDMKRKSATLTPSTDTTNGENTSENSQGIVNKGTNSHSFSSIARPGATQAQQNGSMVPPSRRSSIRRSFTLPRSLLARKSGQTGPVSENQNGSFMKNIFLTLVRTKSVRKPKVDTKDEVDGKGEAKNANSDGSNASQGKHCNGLLAGYTPAAVGLKNQGNTCFMNAIVQCLSHTDCLAKYLVTDGYKTDLRRKHWIKNGKCEVTEELAALLKNAWLRQNPTVLEDAVARFKAAIEKRASQWRGSEQHDAQEFFLWLLDRLHEDLNLAASSKYKPLKNNFGRSDEQVAAEALANHLRCNNSIIQEIFGAHFRSSLTCPGCGRQSATFDPFVCVSLPIPQAKQEVPVYVNIVYLAQQPRQVKLGLSIVSSADIKELKQVISGDTGIEENSILLSEIDGEGFHRTFTETQLVSSLCNNDALYCIETPQIRETNENDGAFLMITWTNILVTNNGNTRVRFGSPYVTQMARETGFVDIQKVFLKEMAAVLQTDVLVSEQKDPVFSIKILDGSSEGSLVDPLVEHPLYMESVDHALSLCDEDVPPHIKVHLEWTPDSKDKIIINDSESVEEHANVAQTRLRHAEESVASVTLGECFDLYTTAEQLSAEDSWHCPHCNRKEQGTLKMIGLWTAPQVLVVHLKRFRQAAKARTAATKISSVVDFPIDGLDLGPHVMRRNRSTDNNVVNSGMNQASSPVNGCFGIGNWKNRASFKKHLSSSVTNNRLNSTNGFGTAPDEIVYDLYAVCNHHGKDVLGGHYTAYCKNPVDGSWWSFDDTRVSKMSSPAEVKSASAYILFYHQRGNACNQQNSLHWCRNLLKKQKTGVTKVETNGIEVPSEKSEETAPVFATCPVPLISTVGGSDHATSSNDGSDSEKQENSESYQLESNGESSDSSSPVLSNGESNFTAPLARMEDVGMGLSPYIKEVQIESTV